MMKTVETSSKRKNKIKVHLLAAATILIWGSGFSFTRMIDGQLSSLSIGFIRCLLPAVVMVIIGLWSHIRKPFCWKDCLLFFLSGALGFSFYMTSFSLGLETLNSATGSIITAVTPILVAMAAVKLYGERISLIGWISIFCAFGGVAVLLFWNGIISITIGAVWMLLTALVFAGYNLMSRYFTGRGYNDVEITTYSAISGTIHMLPFMPRAVSEMLHASVSSNLSVIYLGVVAGGLAYFMWNKALALSERTSEVTNYLFVNPLVAAVIGFLMLHEVPDMGTFLGGFIIIASLVVFSWKGNRE